VKSSSAVKRYRSLDIAVWAMRGLIVLICLPFFMRIFFNQRIPRCSASGFPNNSLPLEGGGLGWGCFVMIIFDTLPFIPSPRGRGDIRYLDLKAFGTAGWFILSN
jgi:hypothetical protein